MASVFHSEEKFEDAIQLYQEGDLNVQLVALKEDHSNTAVIMGNVASVLNDQGKLDEAMKLYPKALDIERNALGEDHPSVTTTYKNMPCSARLLD